MWFPFYFVMLALTCAALAYILLLFVSERICCTKVIAASLMYVFLNGFVVVGFP